MLSFTHTLIGLPFAVYFQHPLIIFLAAMTSHFLADTLPHWNVYPEDFKRYPVLLVVLDVVGGVAVAWLLMGDSFLTWAVWAAIAGSNAPDVVHSLRDLAPAVWRRRYLGWLEPFFAWHDNLQVETARVLPGLWWQAALVVGAVGLVIFA